MAAKKRITELYGVELKQRVIARPKGSVSVSTPEQKDDVLKSARKVIAEHRAVLVALKDR